MSIDHVLTPNEAARIAANVYFTLRDWIHERPIAGVESMPNVRDRVLGAERAGSFPAEKRASLRGTRLGEARLATLHSARTGLRTHSGFGYTLALESQDRTHVVIATRGTRRELSGRPDLFTDARGALAFGRFGPVHKGFKRTFESLAPSLLRDARIASADVIHCVGHSMGGAVATLVAAHYASLGKPVRLYTFGSPRVGCWRTHEALEDRIGKHNIYRTTHDLDPISLVGPYPYVHVNPSPLDDNNLTLRSPTPELFSTANHDAYRYVETTQDRDWSQLRGETKFVDQDNGALARWLLRRGGDTGWVQRLSVRTLSLLFKLFRNELRALSTSVLLGLSATDYLVEILIKGLHRGRELTQRIARLLALCGEWAGIRAAASAEVTDRVVRAILDRMLSALHDLSFGALTAMRAGSPSPLSLLVGTGWALTACESL